MSEWVGVFFCFVVCRFVCMCVCVLVCVFPCLLDYLIFVFVHICSLIRLNVLLMYSLICLVGWFIDLWFVFVIDWM